MFVKNGNLSPNLIWGEYEKNETINQLKLGSIYIYNIQLQSQKNHPNFRELKTLKKSFLGFTLSPNQINIYVDMPFLGATKN